jgi:hypothetical protein
MAGIGAGITGGDGTSRGGMGTGGIGTGGAAWLDAAAPVRTGFGAGAAFGVGASSASGTQSDPHRAHRTARPPAMRASGTS